MTKKPLKNKWDELKTAPFVELLDFFKDKGVKSFTVDGVTVEFWEQKLKAPSLTQVELTLEPTDEQKKQEEEKILYWSSGG